MSSHQIVQLNEHPVTEYNSMDVDNSTESQISTDDLYLGPDDIIDYDSVIQWSGCVGFNPWIKYDYPSQADQPALHIDLDLYLGPDDDLIDCDDELESANADRDAPVAPEISMSLNEKSAKCHSAKLDLTNEELLQLS
ncbi:uncharacterized protein BJ212DRAFT_1306383 [Suillus subaureus]|uniref:Uncharacterized protein n=1 Tax=Suillus subaureus TaxID=48587 RepID=A0A9P7AVZ2_9AGAM|nr:uncharacterized protein BJ212DRAFT_1306383 [Suillus subaureus]KAG1796147.1 hypothetical protein BJ212DRAFT_1306383 [Suillus subaureus]